MSSTIAFDVSGKDIHDLLSKLCWSFVPARNKHRDVLRHVTQYVSNCPTALGSALPYDECSLSTKITQHLGAVPVSTKQSALPTLSKVTANGCTFNKLNLQHNTARFLSLHDQLKASQLDSRQRSGLLTFLYYMAETKFPIQENGYCYRDSSRHKHLFLGGGLLPSSPSNQTLNSLRSHMLQKSHQSSFSINTGIPPVIGKHPMAFGRNNTMMYNNTSNKGSRVTLMRNNGLHRNACVDNDTDSSESSACGRIVVGGGRGGSSNTKLTLRDDFNRQIDTENNLNDDIVQNVIYVFTGIQGRYLRKDVVTGKFKLDVNARKLNVVQAGMMLRLSELGYYHDLVQSYSDTTSGLSALGLMGQGFVSALRNELTRYYGMVAVLQEQLNRQRSSMQDSIMRNAKCNGPTWRERLTLMKLMVWSVDPLYRLQWLSTIAEACREKKGGALACTVYSFLSNGSPMVKALVSELLLAVCEPLYQMMSRWLLEGEIYDPCGEFFIEYLPQVGPDRLWYDKYRVRNAMLPNFISTDMVKKILVTGKSINFLCEICGDKQPVKGRYELRQCIDTNPELIFANVADTKLHSTIDSIYLNTSKHVLDIVMGPHKLLEHIQAMRRYLLLGQGDFIGILMENLKSELDKPAKELYSYDLSSIMDAAVRSTNAQYDDPEILNHLDVRLLTPCDGDIGWDILSLQYTVRGPLATMLEPSMCIYQVLFKLLWRMKHMEFVLSSKIWKDQKCNARLLRPMSAELNKVLYRLHLFTSEMIHFIHQVQYYILFEVIECSWAEFLERVQQAKTLDGVLHAHDEFLNAIKCGAFLDSKSGELSRNMETVYEGITRLEVWQDKFYEICFKELEARKMFKKHIEDSELTGTFGLTSDKQLERNKELKIFEQMVNSYNKSLENIGSDYEKAVRCFLLTLNSNNDHNMLLFGIRLDFNEYYKKRDQRLGVPLTFEHMRMSNVFYSTSKSPLSSRFLGIN